MEKPYFLNRVAFIALFAAMPAGTGGAQEAAGAVETSSPEQAMEACLGSAEMELQSSETCIGTLVSACLSSAITTVDMLECYAPETEYWEGRMAVTFAGLSEAYQSQDQEDDPLRALVPRLEAVQAQWEVWRDANCGFEYDKFRGGSLGRVVSADCHLQETAERTLELEDLLEEAAF